MKMYVVSYQTVIVEGKTKFVVFFPVEYSGSPTIQNKDSEQNESQRRRKESKKKFNEEFFLKYHDELNLLGHTDNYVIAKRSISDLGYNLAFAVRKTQINIDVFHNGKFDINDMQEKLETFFPKNVVRTYGRMSVIKTSNESEAIAVYKQLLEALETDALKFVRV
jgi:hypothetical protein